MCYDPDSSSYPFQNDLYTSGILGFLILLKGFLRLLIIGHPPVISNKISLSIYKDPGLSRLEWTTEQEAVWAIRPAGEAVRDDQMTGLWTLARANGPREFWALARTQRNCNGGMAGFQTWGPEFLLWLSPAGAQNSLPQGHGRAAGEVWA